MASRGDQYQAQVHDDYERRRRRMESPAQSSEAATPSLYGENSREKIRLLSNAKGEADFLSSSSSNEAQGHRMASTQPTSIVQISPVASASNGHSQNPPSTGMTQTEMSAKIRQLELALANAKAESATSTSTSAATTPQARPGMMAPHATGIAAPPTPAPAPSSVPALAPAPLIPSTTVQAATSTPLVPYSGRAGPGSITSTYTRTSKQGTGKSSVDKVKLTSFYVRPGYGTRGRTIEIMSNFFSVRATDGGRAKLIQHYDVEIDPVVKALNQKKPKGLLRAVWEQLVVEQSDNPEPAWAMGFASSAYDGRKNAFTPFPLPIPEGSVAHDAMPGESKTFITAISSNNVVHRPSSQENSSDDENRRFKIVIKLVALIDLEAVMRFCRADETAPEGEEACLTGVMATHVLLRDLPSKAFAQVGATGNRFFTMDGAVPIPQGGMVCRGFMQSLRYSSSGMPLLNIDVCASAFLATGPAIDVIRKIVDRGKPGQFGPRGARGGYMGGIPRPQEITELSASEVALVKNKIRGAKFSVTHRQSSRLHTVMSLTSNSAETITFSIQGKDGADRRVTIPEYYKEFYGVTVTKPRLPCIQYGKKLFIPLEFVNFDKWNSLPPTKLSAEQTGAMVKMAAMKPKDRAEEVQHWRAELAYEKQEKIKAWGLDVNRNMLRLQARILPPPKIQYGNARQAYARDGSWEVRGMKFAKQGRLPLKAWSVVSFDKYSDDDAMKRFIDYLCNTMTLHGINVENRFPALIPPVDPRGENNIKRSLQQAARAAFQAGGKVAPQLICVILPGKDAWLYESIKRISMTELHAPVPTQCMQAVKIREPRGIDAYTGNLVMKIQSKLGGLTHQIPLSELPGMVQGKTMLLGADLGHPPIRAGYESAPTVACSIATFDPDCSLYSAQIRLQEGRDEIVKDLSSMVENHLKVFHKKNNCYPERILIFRDGVSEGQYAATLTYEHQAVLTACSRLQRGYRPMLFICVCAKRHNTRFFGRQTDCDASGNLPAGLVVDKTVTHPYAFDFYLQAHAGRLGTARPTHYICLLDELAITPDQSQQMVNSLCFGFARCTKSVSLVPVCYIADLVCQKARIMVHDPSGDSTYAASESSAGTNAKDKRSCLSDIDVMQIQRVLEKNPELEDVMWWM